MTSLRHSAFVVVRRPCISLLLCLKKIRFTETKIEIKGEGFDGIRSRSLIVRLLLQLLPPAHPSGLSHYRIEGRNERRRDGGGVMKGVGAGNRNQQVSSNKSHNG